MLDHNNARGGKGQCLSNKLVVHKQTLLTQMNQGSHCIIVILTIFNVSEQNDF